MADNERRVIILPVLDEYEPGKGSLIELNPASVISAQEPESLACGQCHKLLTSGMSARALAGMFGGGETLVIKCQCGAYNHAIV